MVLLYSSCRFFDESLVSELHKQKGRGTQLTALEVLVYPHTDKRAHAVTWAFYLSSRVFKNYQFSNARLKANALNYFINKVNVYLIILPFEIKLKIKRMF